MRLQNASGSVSYSRRFVSMGNVRLHAVLAGPTHGPLVLLLHGFPEFWYGWRLLIPALATAGYRVWAPDQRGYNRSTKPHGVASYAIDRLGQDVIGLIEAAGCERVVVIGHDWGGAVAWWVAARYPEKLRKLIVINMPHGDVMREHLRHNPRQMMRSWYAAFFQLPVLPELLLKADHGWLMAMALRRSSRPGTFTSVELERYREAWSRPGARQAMLNWYRAARRRTNPGAEESGKIRVPTLLIWGARDRFLGREMARPTVERCEDGRLTLVETATHWVHHEEPALVATEVLSFIEPTGAHAAAKV